MTRRVVESTGIELSREQVRQLMAARRPQQPDQLTLGQESEEAGHNDTHEGGGDEATNSVDESDGAVEFAHDGDETDTVEVTDVGEGHLEGGGSAASFDPPAVLPRDVAGGYIG